MLHLNHLKKSFGKNEILTDIEYTFEEGIKETIGWLKGQTTGDTE